MLTVRELINQLKGHDGNTPIFVPSVVGYDPATKSDIKPMCFRGSYQEPGEWELESHADEKAINRGQLMVVVIE